MSDFVDYHKRSVTLPPGCKDLMDLFDPPAPMDVSFAPPPQVLNLKTKALPSFEEGCHESGTVALDEIGPLLQRAYESQMPVCNLALHGSADETVQWSLMRMREPIEALHGVLNLSCASPKQMKAADRIFAAHGLPPRPRKNFHLCKPEAPPDIDYIIDPMPPEATACAQLVQALFQALVPNSSAAPLQFTYRELRRKA